MGFSVGPLGHVEDNNVCMKLWRDIAIDRAGRIVLKLGGDKFPCGLGRMIAADAGLRIVFQLVEAQQGRGTGLTGPNWTMTQIANSLQVLERIGGDDGTRTRGLCRDRDLRVRNYLKAKSTDGSLRPLKQP